MHSLLPVMDFTPVSGRDNLVAFWEICPEQPVVVLPEDTGAVHENLPGQALSGHRHFMSIVVYKQEQEEGLPRYNPT